jgi:hypothetical protein
MKFPAVHVTVAIDFESVSPEGKLTYAWRIVAASLEAGVQVSGVVGEAFQDQVGELERVSGKGEVTSRGIATISVDSTTDDEADGGALLVQVEEALRDLAVTFPEEEVGKSARWQKLLQDDSADGGTIQAETVTLAEVKSDGATVDGVIAQMAPPLRELALLDESKLAIDSVQSSGKRRTRIGFARLVPEARSDTETVMLMHGPSPSGTMERLSMSVRAQVVIGTAR